MHRRQFLHNSGFIIPAVVLAPSMVWAADAVQADLLIIQASFTGNREKVVGAARAVSGSVQVLKLEEVKEMISENNRLRLRMINGEQYAAEKIVVQAPYVMVEKGSGVMVKASEQNWEMGYATKENNALPEFWSFSAQNLDKDCMQLFLRRKGTAFMCVR